MVVVVLLLEMVVVMMVCVVVVVGPISGDMRRFRNGQCADDSHAKGKIWTSQGSSVIG